MTNWFKNNKWLIQGTKDTLEQGVLLALFVALAMIVNFACIELEIPPNIGIITLFLAVIWCFNLGLAKQNERTAKRYNKSKDPLEE